MKKTSRAILLCLATSFILFACEDDNDNNNPTIPQEEQTFILKASQSNVAEINAGNLADSTADTVMVKNFGQQMVTDHTAAQNDLKDLGTNLNIAINDSADSMHIAMLDTLLTLSGRPFDSAYIISQIADHQAAISLFENEINSGTQSDVMNYANKYLPMLKMHLQRADSIATVLNFK